MYGGQEQREKEVDEVVEVGGLQEVGWKQERKANA